MFTSPLLAATIHDITKLQFPLVATPKIDGIRCLTLPPSTKGKKCQAVTRKWKPIPNNSIRDWLECHVDPGFDGELVSGDFQSTSSAVMSKGGTPDWKYWIFDHVVLLYEPYIKRLNRALSLIIDYDYVPVNYVQHIVIHNLFELEEYETQCLLEGYEGVMLRCKLSSYKCGRSTLTEKTLLKLKRIDNSEAYIVGAFEEMSNNNPAEEDAFGYMKRSTSKANKTPKGRLGGFLCKPEEAGKVTKTDIEWFIENKHRLKMAVQEHPYFFSVGSGFNDIQRKEWWQNKELIAKRITYDHQKIGAKTEGKPRFPRFKGFRPNAD